MGNETVSQTFNLKSTDPDVFKKEGIITRGSVDAKEILKTKRYVIIGDTPGKVQAGTGTPVKADKAPTPAEDMEAKIKKIGSMNTGLLNGFVESEGLDIDLSVCKNLNEKRDLVIEAMTIAKDELDELDDL